ncbi:hypothetical protein GWK47_048589 [Chionoecetes opilio]|uniref:Uncharacterized protein n=1 Tax=Chionoecetes opilio TaxID=41210 RepID=A0A8J4YBU0_CHIOP|nr:hypothetical protein GWK47_048589 [Chionoecetes opilio]
MPLDEDVHMDTISAGPKRSRSPSPSSGIKFEVANLDNLAQPPESVTTLGEWSVKCWVASDDDPTYMFGRIFPILPN